MSGTTPRKTDAFGVFGAVTALATLFFGVIAVYVGASDDTGTDTATATAAAAPVAVTLGDLFIEPGALEVAAGDVTFAVTNSGATAHDLTVEELGVATPSIDGGGSATLEAGSLTAGDYTSTAASRGTGPPAWRPR